MLFVLMEKEGSVSRPKCVLSVGFPADPSEPPGVPRGPCGWGSLDGPSEPLQRCPLSTDAAALNAEEKAVLVSSTKSPISFLSKLGQTISRKRSPKVSGSGFDLLRAQQRDVVLLRTTQSGSFLLQDKKEKDLDGAGKRRKTSQSEEVRVMWHFLEKF